MKKWFKTFAVILSIVSFNFVSKAKADDFGNIWNRSDTQEHMVTSYALTFTSYMIYSKKLEMSREDSVLLSAVTGLALGYLRDQFLFHHDHMAQYMESNAIGVTTSVLLTYSFQF